MDQMVVLGLDSLDLKVVEASLRELGDGGSAMTLVLGKLRI